MTAEAEAFLYEPSMTHAETRPAVSQAGPKPFRTAAKPSAWVSYFKGRPELFILETLADKAQRARSLPSLPDGGGQCWPGGCGACGPRRLLTWPLALWRGLGAK